MISLEEETVQKARYFLSHRPETFGERQREKLTRLLQRYDKKGSRFSARDIALMLGDSMIACKIANNGLYPSNNIVAQKYGYLQYVLENYEKVLDLFKRSKNTRETTFAQRKYDELQQLLAGQLRDVDTLTLFAGDSGDPLLLLHPFMERFKAFQVDDRNDGWPQGLEGRALEYHRYSSQGLYSLSFDIKVSGHLLPKSIMYSLNPYHDSWSSFFPKEARDTFITLHYDLYDGPGQKKMKESEILHISRVKGHLRNQFALRHAPERPPNGLHTRLDYLVQKFLRGSYDKTRPILVKETPMHGGNAVIEKMVGLLFTDGEKRNLQQQLHEAQLRLRGGWQSLPSLNLGTIQLPPVGHQTVARDSFLIAGAAYLVASLSQLGVMSTAKAEELVARKLTHYFLHQGSFQRSTGHARKVVAALESQTRTLTGERAS